jgi:hypothetical protein
MMLHGGEPVPDPTLHSGMSDFQPFCAQRKVCVNDTSCSVREFCEDGSRTCQTRESCTSTAQCNISGEICNTTIGQCVRPCSLGTDCEQNEICNTTTQFCEPT